jgi:hypothetical protein
METSTTTKAQFGFDSLAKHSPKWLVPAFSASIAIIGVIAFMVSGDPAIADELKLRINHYLTGITMLISVIAPFFGVDIKAKTEV